MSTHVIRRISPSSTILTTRSNPFLPPTQEKAISYEYWRASVSGGDWVTDQELATRGTEQQAREALSSIDRPRDGGGPAEVVQYHPPMKPPSEWSNY